MNKIMKNIEIYDRITGTDKLEKIIIVTSKSLDITKSYNDMQTKTSYMDSATRTGKLIFLADNQKLKEFESWMKEVGQWNNVDEIYIYDRYHKTGHDMIKKAKMKRHKYSWKIDLKPEYEKCWFNGEVSGCKLWSEHALDPKNERF